MLTQPRLNLLPLLLALLSTTSLTACRKEKTEPASAVVLVSPEEAKRSAEAARKSLDELQPAFAALKDELTGLHQEFDPLPPGLPGFGETRSKFYSLSIALGALSAKPAWLSGRIDAAAQSRSRVELEAIAKDITDTQAQVRQAGGALGQLRQQVKPFHDEAAIRMEALQARGKTTCE